MEESLINLLERFSGLAILIPLLSIGYLVVNFYFQIRAKRRLELILKKHRKNIEDHFKNQNKNNKSIDEEYEILLSVLRKEILGLKGKIDKEVLQKTLDRKNLNNQKRYAFKIFSEIGMLDSLKLKNAT